MKFQCILCLSLIHISLGEEGDVYLIGAKGSVYAKKEKNHALTEESPVEVFSIT